MNILAIDTSGKTGGAAVFCGGTRLACVEREAISGHSGALLPLCSEVLQKSGLDIVQIDLFAAAAGPGSFTGVRIGISAVKGFGWTQGKPCAAVSTLHAMACAARVDGLLCCRVAAREGEWYYAVFERKNGKTARLTPDSVGQDGQISRELERLGVAHVLDDAQSAEGVALAALELARSGLTQSCHEIAPLYLKKPQAQRVLEEKLGREV